MAEIKFDRDRPRHGFDKRANQYNLDIRKAIAGYKSWYGMAQSLLKNNFRELNNCCQQNSQWTLIEVDPPVETSIDNLIYFITEAKIIELLKTAGFTRITNSLVPFHLASRRGHSPNFIMFLFGAWIAKYTGI